MDQREVTWDHCPQENRTVAQFRRKVLFLGAVESQYNTACYKLFNREDDGLQLKCPEGAILEDVAPWNTGFKLILARHRFQRSFESCFAPIRVIPYVNRPSARLAFRVPPNPYIFRRMLGLEGNRKLNVQSPGNLPIPQAYESSRPYFHNDATYGSDDNVRRQLNRCRLLSFESHTPNLTNQYHAGRHTIGMAPPPLYPPLWHLGDHNQIVLKYSSKAIRLYIPSIPGQPMDGATCKYGQQWYKIVKKEVMEYEWIRDTTEYNLSDPNSYEDKRFGDDYCWYFKHVDENTNTYSQCGFVQMYCLQQCPPPQLPPPDAVL